MQEFDTRLWTETDRPGERLTLARPVPELELMSVEASTRLWTEVHTQFCLALIRPDQPGVGANWQTRARALSSGPGSLMLIEPGDVHATHAVSRPADFDVVRFLPEVFQRASEELGLPPGFHFRAPISESPPVCRAILELIRAHADGEAQFQISARSAELVTLILAELGERKDIAALDPVRDYRLRRVREYLRSHLVQKPSLDELAVELKLSKYRLCTIFKLAYGVSVGQYWMAARIAEASRLLLGGTPIKLVAAQLGFVDEAFFTRIFRKHRGMPPASWVRLQQRNSPRSRGEPLLRIA
jgi:AraC-like DNA-binding protein